MTVLVNVNEYFELMLYLSGGYDFNTSEDVEIRLLRNIGFNTVGDVIDYKRTFPDANSNLTIFNYKNSGGGNLILNLNDFTIEGIYSNKATSIIDFNGLSNCEVINGSIALDIQKTGNFYYVYGSGTLFDNNIFRRVNVALNVNSGNISSLLYYVIIKECQLLLTGSTSGTLPYLNSSDENDGLLIFCDNLTTYSSIILSRLEKNRVGIVGTLIVSGVSIEFINNSTTNINIFIDLTIVSNNLNRFDLSTNSINSGNSIFILRFVKSNFVDLISPLTVVSKRNIGYSSFLNIVCGDVSRFVDSFDSSRKSHYFINNYISPDLYSDVYLRNVLGFQFNEDL